MQALTALFDLCACMAHRDNGVEPTCLVVLLSLLAVASVGISQFCNTCSVHRPSVFAESVICLVMPFCSIVLQLCMMAA